MKRTILMWSGVCTLHTTLSCVDSIYLIWQQTQNCLTAACCQFYHTIFFPPISRRRVYSAGAEFSETKRNENASHSPLLLACGQRQSNKIFTNWPIADDFVEPVIANAATICRNESESSLPDGLVKVYTQKRQQRKMNQNIDATKPKQN